MKKKEYDRSQAVAYARRWALFRNPAYADFEEMGGDCTNFVSQCLFAGSGVMNFTPVFGWYYINFKKRSPAWSGVEYLWRFLVENKGPGPYGSAVGLEAVKPGDVVQLGRIGAGFTHAALITETAPRILVCAHTYDSLDRPLDTYDHELRRFFHVDGVMVDANGADVI